MRLLAAALVAAFLVSACGMMAQVEPAQDGDILVTSTPPVWDCHVLIDAQEDAVAFRASEACTEGRIIPFTIDAEWGTVYDGGVYAGNVSLWPARPGTFEVVHGQHGATIAFIHVGGVSAVGR